MGEPILVALRPLGLGDLLTGVPALRALAASYPEHRLVLAAPSWQSGLAKLSGAVDEVVDVEPLNALPRSLHGADLAVNLHGRGPLSTDVLIAAHPHRLIAFDIDGCAVWRLDEHERVRWCRLLAEAGIPADPDDYRLTVPKSLRATRAVGATVIHPGAASAARRWPAERWAVIAASEHCAGRPVLITGSPNERHLALWVAQAAGIPAEAVLAGRTTALELLGIVAAAARLVSTDTGIAHLASAVGTPSVVLFGPTPPSQWGPPTDGPHISLWYGYIGNPLGQTIDPGLAAITIDDVLAALADLESYRELANPPAERRLAPR
jgi:ADP-heptose:LPS heptosyltransferase